MTRPERLPDELGVPLAEQRGEAPADPPGERLPDRVTGNGALRSLRERIDELDREIVWLLNERARVGVEIGHRKAAAGLRIHDPGREDEVLRSVASANGGPIGQEELLALYRRIIALTRALEGGPDETPPG